jgi:hypothetical protein
LDKDWLSGIRLGGAGIGKSQMKKNLAGRFIMAAITFFLWSLPYFLNTALPTPTNTGFGSGTAPAQILQIIDQGTVNLAGINQPDQDLFDRKPAGMPIPIDLLFPAICTDPE